MAKTKTQETSEVYTESTNINENPNDGEQSSAVVKSSSDLSSLFSRAVNSSTPIKSITFKRTLTKPLIAMAHLRQLLFECRSEVYTMDLPLKGRAGGVGAARVIDGLDIESNEEVTLIVNEMIASAWQRAGFAMIASVKQEGKENALVQVAGNSIIGHTFGLRRGDMNADKGYRVIDVVEVGVER